MGRIKKEKVEKRSNGKRLQIEEIISIRRKLKNFMKREKADRVAFKSSPKSSSTLNEK